MVGGLPKNKVPPFEYKAPFSPIDVIEEYLRPARFIENSELVIKPALTDAEMVTLFQAQENNETPLALESFNTDGLRSLLFTMKHIPNMKEKTLRYPGHIHLIKAFIDAGFFDDKKINIKGCDVSPIEFSSKLLFKQWKLEEEEPEFTIMQIKVSGNRSGKKSTVVYDLYDEYDPETKTSSMARTTGYTCTAAVNLLVHGLFSKKGVFPPEMVSSDAKCFHYIMDYLKQRNVIYRVKEN
jgi:saccharopine dehydrogenase-like NADP-dependent oxidoreductase